MRTLLRPARYDVGKFVLGRGAYAIPMACFMEFERERASQATAKCFRNVSSATETRRKGFGKGPARGLRWAAGRPMTHFFFGTHG